MNKVVYIIPGFGYSTRQKAYKEIAKYFKSKGIKPIPVNISWKYKVMSDYIEEFMKKYKDGKNNKVYIIGFSFGAFIINLVGIVGGDLFFVHRFAKFVEHHLEQEKAGR